MLSFEELESRDLPAALVLGGYLFVVESGPGPHTVSLSQQGAQYQLTEGDGNPAHDVSQLFSGLAGACLFGSPDGPNVMQQLTPLPCLLVGGRFGDTLFGGTGTNWLDGLGGADVVYSLLGTNTINSAGDGSIDRVFTNYSGQVTTDPGELVVRFFAPQRAPGTPYLAQEGDGVLYITTGNADSRVYLLPGAAADDVLAVYDLGDGRGVRASYFQAVKNVSYFGGAGNDTLVNLTAVDMEAYGGAGNDFLAGGRGRNVLKGLAGNDVVWGRGAVNDLSGNAGADTLIGRNNPGDVFRVDAADQVFGAAGGLLLSP